MANYPSNGILHRVNELMQRKKFEEKQGKLGLDEVKLNPKSEEDQVFLTHVERARQLSQPVEGVKSSLA